MTALLSGPICTLTLAVVNGLSQAPPTPEQRNTQAVAPLQVRAPTGLSIGAHPLPPPSPTGEPERTPSFAVLCKAPCTAELSLGEHELAVLRDDEQPLVAFPAFRLSGPATVALEVTSHQTERTLGVWILAVSIPLGAASTALGMIPTCNYEETCARNASLALWGGIGLMSFGGLFGVPLMLKKDDVTLRVEPNTRSLALEAKY